MMTIALINKPLRHSVLDTESSLSKKSTRFARYWIPACAGMTIVENQYNKGCIEGNNE